MAARTLGDPLGNHLEKTPLDDLGVGGASYSRSLFDPFGGFGEFSILGNSRMAFSHSLVHASMIPLESSNPAPASWSTVGSEARHRCRLPDGVLRPHHLLPALENGVVDAGCPCISATALHDASRLTSPTGLRHAAQGCAERYPGIAENRQTPASNRNAVPS